MGGHPGGAVEVQIGLRLPVRVQRLEGDVVPVGPLRVPPPGLAGEGAQVPAEVGGVVAVDHMKFPVSIFQEAHRRVVPVAHGVGLPGGQIQELCQKGADRHAVAHRRDALPGISLPQVRHRLQHPLLQMFIGLRAGDGEGGGVVIEGQHLLRLVPGQVPEGTVLPGPAAQLPEAGVGMDGQVVVFRDGSGGAPGARQVAGPDRRHRKLPEALGQGVDLPQSPGGDAAVVPALAAAVDIPLRLAVADQIDAGHRLLLSFLPEKAKKTPPGGAPGRDFPGDLLTKIPGKSIIPMLQCGFFCQFPRSLRASREISVILLHSGGFDKGFSLFPAALSPTLPFTHPGG